MKRCLNCGRNDDGELLFVKGYCEKCCGDKYDINAIKQASAKAEVKKQAESQASQAALQATIDQVHAANNVASPPKIDEPFWSVAKLIGMGVGADVLGWILLLLASLARPNAINFIPIILTAIFGCVLFIVGSFLFTAGIVRFAVAPILQQNKELHAEIYSLRNEIRQQKVE